MDRDKVIKDLEEVAHLIKIDNLPAHTLKALLTIDDAIALLKAQEPVEPQEKREGDYKNLYCGACGRGIVGYVGHLTGKRLNVSDYCNKCGKAVKKE